MKGREAGSSFSFLVTVSTSQSQMSPGLRPRMVLGTELEPRMVIFEPDAPPLNEFKCLGMDFL